MDIKDLKVGDKVFIREDIEDWKIYGTLIYYPNMQTGVVKVTYISGDYFKIQDGIGYLYGAEMVDWDKTIKLRREKMKLKDLKVGDLVFIREDVNNPEKTWFNKYDEPRLTGVQQVFEVYYGNEYFEIIGELDKAWVNRNRYTVEMIDWGKTSNLKINESWESIKKELRGDGTFKEIIQSGESGNETTKAITQSGEEITVKNNNEENDVEKAVMLLMLKSLGVTYGDVKKEAEKVKVKWVPKQGEKYYWINSYLEINWDFWAGLRVDKILLKSGNCFKTKKEVEEKLEKIKEVLKGE